MNPSSAKITHCPELRDKIFEHLPPQARKSLIGVEVKFWPNNHGEMELNLKYNATDSLLDIEATEGIYGPEGTLTGSFVRGCELHSETAEVHAYSEDMVARGSGKQVDSSLRAIEMDATCFDSDKLSFLLNLFDCL